MLRVPRKLPPDVLQGCYGATDAVIYRAAQRHEGCKQATHALLPLGHGLISRRASWTRSVPQQRSISNQMLAPASVGQDVLDGRARKRRGSKNQISMTAPVTAAAIQQAAARAGA